MTTKSADPSLTKPLIDKMTAGHLLDKDDLSLLNTLVSMNEAGEPEPDDRVIDSGTGENAAPMIRTKSTSAGYVNLRRASDGKIRPVNRNQLADRLRQKLEDGTPAWLPPNTPWDRKVLRGTVLCLLHQDHPDRKNADALALPYCRKANLLNDYAMRRHVRLKHKEAWNAIQRAEDQRREDQRDTRDQAVADAISLALGNRTEAPTPAKAAPVVLECEVCRLPIEAGGRLAAANKMRAHMKKEHPPKE